MREWLTYSSSYWTSISVLSRLLFISWKSPLPSLSNWPRVQLYRKVPNHIYVLKWSMIPYLIYFGFIGCLHMHLFWQVFGGNSRLTQNWVTNSSYAWFSFVKKIHAMSFIFNFPPEIIFCSIVQFLIFDKYFLFTKSNLHENFFMHLRHSLSFLFFCFHWKIAWHLGKVHKKVRLRESATELTRSPRVWGWRVSTSPLFTP